MKLRDPERILVAMLVPIGDMLFCQPALAGIRRRFPQARITALVPTSLAPLAEANPDIAEVIVCDITSPADIDELIRVEREIHARRFALMVSFNMVGNIVALFSGIRRRIGQRLPPGFWLGWGARDPAYRHRHAVEHYWNVVARLGIFPQSSEDHIPQWQVSEEERAAAHSILTHVGVQWGTTTSLVVLHPGAHGFGGSKRWPVESFAKLARRLVEQQLAPDHPADGPVPPAQVVVLGGPEDVEAAAAIVAATDGRALSLAGKTNLRESVAVIANAGVYVGCDSGLTQIAVALGVPTVALFGVSNLEQFAPRTTTPERLRILLPDPLLEPVGFFVGTEPLFARHDYAHDTRMATISVDDVLEATLALCRCGASVPISPPIAG